jgi:hypothetical protein
MESTEKHSHLHATKELTLEHHDDHPRPQIDDEIPETKTIMIINNHRTNSSTAFGTDRHDTE